MASEPSTTSARSTFRRPAFVFGSHTPMTEPDRVICLRITSTRSSSSSAVQVAPQTSPRRRP
ncbi:hypothetical protein KBI5_15495 [Frankia sp. KB5]|nr:hypothetical protein KBI5_15495 [Frankia sp. KB5]